MQQPQLLVYGRPAELLQELAQRRAVPLREVAHARTCRNLLRAGGPVVLVLHVGRDLNREFALLDEVSRLFPETAAVVVGDVDHPAVAGLAWDLGARYVLFPPQPAERLPDVVGRLLPG